MLIQLFLAFTAGVLTILAPCILPVLPILLGSSAGQRDRWRPVLVVAGFVIAFCGTILLFSAVTSFAGLSAGQLRNIAAGFILLFGLAMIWPGPHEWLMARAGALMPAGRGAGRASAPLLVGASLGLVWTPCAGPVLGSILVLVATAPDLVTSGALLLSYAVGSALPMLLIAYGGQYATTRVRAISHYTRRIQIVSGVMMILISILIFSTYDSIFVAYLSQFYPNGRTGL